MSSALDQGEDLSKTQSSKFDLDLLTPAEIVAELDKYIISQEEAKRSVAIALRNRWRRLQVPEDFRDEITPKNIIMIGPTGVGKTEISRRLAKLARAPFVKVEASKFTEVGYVGRDVESIIRDLVDSAYNMVKEEERKRVLTRAETEAEERLLDLLLPGFDGDGGTRAHEEPQAYYSRNSSVFLQDESGIGIAQPVKGNKFELKTRERFRELLHAGKLEERVVEFEVVKHSSAQLQVLGPQGFGEIEGQIKEMFSNMIPKQKESRKLPVSEARRVLTQEAQEQLIDHELVVQIALKRAEETGIVFIDEIDKICGRDGNKGPDVSREGVQRDLLPIVEGCTVNTKFGPIKTDHVLFIASGAFHVARPSDLMPEFQGRFPIRVELKSLTPEHFIRILTEPQNALTKQYIELLKTEGVRLEFSQDAIAELAKLTAEVNSHAEDIGARRLHTLLEKLLEDLLFSAQDFKDQTVSIDRGMVQEKLSDIVKNTDLSRFIL